MFAVDFDPEAIKLASCVAIARFADDVEPLATTEVFPPLETVTV